MTKSEKLVELYRQLLTTCSHTVDEDGRVFLEAVKGKPTPIVVNDKDLYLPMAHHLRHPEENQIFFHPMSEQITRGESEIFTHLKRAMILKMITSMSMIGTGLLALQNDTAAQRRMSIDQVNIIMGLVDTDKEKSGTAWLAMMFREIKENPHRMDTWPLNIHMRRNGKFEGKPYRRVAVTHFPLLEKLFSGEKLMDDAGKDRFRKKDYLMFQQVAKAIFPDVDKPLSETYNEGYDGTLAPYTVCFLRAYKKLADRINHILTVMEEPLLATNSDYKILAGINTDWWELISPEGEDELTTLAKSIPPLAGNMGQSADGQEQAQAAEERPETRIGKFSVRDRAPETKEEVKVEEKLPPKVDNTEIRKQPDNFSNEGLNAEQIKQRDEAMRRRKEFLEREEQERKDQEERESRRRQRDEEDRREYERRNERRDEPRDRDYRRDDRNDDRGRDRRDNDRYDDRGRDYRDEDRRDAKTESGKLSFTAILDRNPGIMRGTLSDEDDRHRGGRRGGRYDDRDDDRGRGSRYDDRGRGSRYESRYDDRRYDRYDDYDRGSRYSRR